MAANDLWWSIHRHHPLFDLLARVQNDENLAYSQKDQGLQVKEEGDLVPGGQFSLIGRCC